MPSEAPPVVFGLFNCHDSASWVSPSNYDGELGHHKDISAISKEETKLVVKDTLVLVTFKSARSWQRKSGPQVKAKLVGYS
ncbi:hypothetical protein TNCT_569591 [Trichonephila clavata]|uniref:Uncharacterized protein n=1 Tax=Trichonephila clavata TaxID=2740835 RepID=A0A8X6F5I0_TRICU|nr:hypothetical protein TNCT_569591 [Trichonephila clavata]